MGPSVWSGWSARKHLRSPRRDLAGVPGSSRRARSRRGCDRLRQPSRWPSPCPRARRRGLTTVAMMDRPKRCRLLGPNTWREGSGRMTSPFTARQAGLASIVAAGLILVSQVSQVVLPLTLPESFWVATQSLRMGLALLAMFALLLALTGLYARQVPEAGELGFVGYLAAFLGTLLVAGNWWYEAFIGPALREQAPELLATAPSSQILFGAVLTGVIFAAGWVTFGVATLRAASFLGAQRSCWRRGSRACPAFFSPFQVPLALAVGWLRLWLLRSKARSGSDYGPAACGRGAYPRDIVRTDRPRGRLERRPRREAQHLVRWHAGLHRASRLGALRLRHARAPQARAPDPGMDCRRRVRARGRARDGSMPGLIGEGKVPA